MKLLQIHIAREAWKRIAVLAKPVEAAYQMKAYEALVRAEIKIIDEMRNELLIRITKTDPTDDEALRRLSVKPGTPEFDEFTKEWLPLLDQESKLKPAPFDMRQFVAILAKRPENVVSEDDLELLEPFFEQRGIEEETG